MAEWKFTGIDQYVFMLEQLDRDTDKIIGKSIFQGAKIVADEMKRAIQDIPTDNRIMPPVRTGIMSIQKRGLYNSFGIAPLLLKGNYWNVKLGFDGYNDIGQPNAMIARSVESGTSFMPKFQTFTKATNSSKKKCEETMKTVFEQEIVAIKNGK